jgi:Protein of unknown function (DUF2934)
MPTKDAKERLNVARVRYAWSIQMANEQQIRNYAHQLWEKAGRPEGRDAEFWHAAEVELNAESESPDAQTQSDQPNGSSLPG